MDALDALMAKARRRERRKRNSWRIAVAVILILTICAVLLYVNQFDVKILMQGDQEITLEYGQHYAEPGAEAVFTGRFFPTEDVKLEVAIKGTANENQVGTHTIEYTASYGVWKDTAVRTVHVVDSVAPQILLRTSRAAYTIPGQPYEEEGFAARDNYDGDITDRVQVTEKGGIVTYSVADSSGNSTEVTRDIVYYDPIPPELTLEGGETVTINAGDVFADPGYTAMDNSAGNLTGRVQVTGKINIYKAGTYKLEYYVEDVYDNAASAVRTVEVKAVAQPETVRPEDKVIYLTFDDGPGPYTEELLEVLRPYGVKVTFFVCDTDYVEVLEKIAADGHSIGIHSVTHNYKSIYASEEAYFADLFEMQSIIEEHTGIKTTLVRFPGGGSNTVSRFNPGIMTRLSQALHDMGFQYFDWNVDSDDAGGARSSKKVLKNVKEGIENKQASIVLQHDIKEYSVEAVEDIILWGLENGYVFRALNATSPTFHHAINN